MKQCYKRCLFFLATFASSVLPAFALPCFSRDGVILRGPPSPAVAFVFTGDQFNENGDQILNDLASLRIPAGFFLTGNFLRNEANAFFLRRLVQSGHYLGPHSDAHLEYADGYGRTLVSHSIFQNDLLKNITALSRFTALAEGGNRYWIFPFETGNAELSRWSEDLGWKPFSFSPGLLTQTDYIREGERGFIQSHIILENFRARLRRNEMPGSIFLMHTGSGGRKDPVSALIPTMAAELRANGYTFARIDRLLAGCR